MEAVSTAPVPVDLEQEVFEDYYGFDSSEKWYFPDGKQYIEFKVMTEGAKARFQKLTNRDLILERTSGNARMKVDQASERHALLEESVTFWYMLRKNEKTGKPEPIPYSAHEFKNWLNKANPKLVEDLEKAIRKANPWLLAEMTVEDIDREIENLKEMREVAEKRERGEETSSDK